MLTHARCSFGIRPVGGKERSVDVHVVLATNRDVASLVRGGELREDLYARMCSYILPLRPLADRRQEVLTGYLDAVSEHRTDAGGARFFFEQPAWRALVRFVHAPASTWRHNYRDVRQSAERMIHRAWARAGYRATRSWIRLDEAIVQTELDELGDRWQRDRRAPSVDHDAAEEACELSDAAADPWSRLTNALAPGELDNLSQLDRWRALYLWDARQRFPSNAAAAWRWIEEQRLLPTSSTNPTTAFRREWSKFRWNE